MTPMAHAWQAFSETGMELMHRDGIVSRDDAVVVLFAKIMFLQGYIASTLMTAAASQSEEWEKISRDMGVEAHEFINGGFHVLMEELKTMAKVAEYNDSVSEVIKAWNPPSDAEIAPKPEGQSNEQGGLRQVAETGQGTSLPLAGVRETGSPGDVGMQGTLVQAAEVPPRPNLGDVQAGAGEGHESERGISPGGGGSPGVD